MSSASCEQPSSATDDVPQAVTVTVEPCGNVSGAASVGSTSLNHDERTHTFRKRRLSLTTRTGDFDLEAAAAQVREEDEEEEEKNALPQTPHGDASFASDTVLKLPGADGDNDRPQSPPLKHLHIDQSEGVFPLQSSNSNHDESPVKAQTFRKRRLSMTTSSSVRDDLSTASGLSFSEADHQDGQKNNVQHAQQMQHVDLQIQSPSSSYQPNHRRRRASDASLSSLDSLSHRPLKSRIVHASELLAQPPPSPALMPYLYQTSAPPADAAPNASIQQPRWKKRHTNHDETTLPFPRHIVGTYSCHGIEPVYDDDFSDAAVDPADDRPTTAAKINQDRGGVAFPYANSSRTALFAAYDGHGHGGELVSQFALHEIQRRLEKHPEFRSDISKAFKDTFLAVDDALKKETIIEPLYAGTTACVVLLRGNTIVVSNAGDSRAVLARKRIENQENGESAQETDPTSSEQPKDEGAEKAAPAKSSEDPDAQVSPDGFEAVDLSKDQNPDLPEEQARIEKMGGYVSPPPEPGLSARVWLDPGHSQIGLAMARSIGDHAVKQVGVIAEPVVTMHAVDAERDEFIVIATDGVWEFISSEEAVRIVASNLPRGATKACQSLIEAAAARWHDEEGDYRDDITALVVRLPNLWKNASKSGPTKPLTPTKE